MREWHMWELFACPNLEHAASVHVWGHGGKIANRKLEAVHEWVGRKLLGASTSVAGAAVRRDLGKQGKVLYGYTGLMTAGWSDR